MHRSLLIVILCICACGMISPSSQAEKAGDARKAILDLYTRRTTAYNHKDSGAYLATFAPEYVAIGKSGRAMHFPELRQRISEALTAKVKTHFSTSIQKLTVNGNQATAIVTEHTITTGNYPKTKAPYKIVTDSKLQVSWSKEKLGWQQKSAKTLSLRQIREE